MKYILILIVSSLMMMMLPSFHVYGTWIDDQVESLDELYTIQAKIVDKLDDSRAALPLLVHQQNAYRFVEVREPPPGDDAKDKSQKKTPSGVGEGEGAKKSVKSIDAKLKAKEKPSPKFPTPPPMPPGQRIQFPGYPYPYVRPSRDYLNKLGKEQYLNMWRATAWQGPYDPTATYPTTTTNYYAPSSDPYARGRDITAPNVRYHKVQEQLMQHMNPLLKNVPLHPGVAPPNYQLPAQIPTTGYVPQHVQPYLSPFYGAVWPHRTLPDLTPWSPTENVASFALDPTITPHGNFYSYTNTGSIPTAYPFTAYYGSAPQSWTMQSAP